MKKKNMMENRTEDREIMFMEAKSKKAPWNVQSTTLR